MAHAINTASALQHAVYGAFATAGNAAMTVLRTIGRFFVKLQNANSRIELIEKLHNMTDTELATQYGINRDGIAAYVFRDKMY